MTVLQIVIAGVLAVLITLASWRSLLNPRSHGFYRFFGFSATAVIIVINLPFWAGLPYTAVRVISDVLLSISLVFVLWGVWLLVRVGGRGDRGESPETLGFEETARLVTTGLYRWIRHPMYSSLLFLAWGGCLKEVTVATILLAVIATAAFAATAKFEERENIAFFGDEYRDYMQRSRMFIPYIL